jgi:hypothetical protein
MVIVRRATRSSLSNFYGKMSCVEDGGGYDRCCRKAAVRWRQQTLCATKRTHNYQCQVEKDAL